MKYRLLFIIVMCVCFSTCLIVFPTGGTQGAVKGLQLCYSVIIPSLFPFTVCALLLFESNAVMFISKYVSTFSEKLFCINGKMFSIFIISCIGGYPVGAKLIEKAYCNGEVSKKNAEIMLGYCVNSGPSFIIIAVGSVIFGSTKLGVILYISNILATLIIALVSSRFIKPEKALKTQIKNSTPFSEIFVNSTYEATYSMLGICAFVVLFSSIIGLIDNIITSTPIKYTLLSILEITNGITYSEKNIYIISFLLGFAGLCAHFQVLSMCKTLKPNYLKFLEARIFHGALSAIITSIIIKIFKIAVPVISLNRNYSALTTQYSIVFSVALFVLSICFMVSVRKTFKTV